MLKAPIARGLGSCSLRQLGCSAPPHPRARPRPHHGPATAWPTPLPQYPPPPPSILPAGRACSTLYVTPPAGDCGNRRSRPAQAARAGISETAASDPNAFDSNASAVAAAQLLHEALESMEGRIVERLDEQGQQTKDEVKKMVKYEVAALLPQIATLLRQELDARRVSSSWAPQQTQATAKAGSVAMALSGARRMWAAAWSNPAVWKVCMASLLVLGSALATAIGMGIFGLGVGVALKSLTWSLRLMGLPAAADLMSRAAGA